MPFPPLPEGISSFGATYCDGAIYVFGGHMGRIPGSSVDSLAPHFCRCKVSSETGGSGAAWEELPMQQSSQSPGLVSWNGAIYRVGGLSFKNKSGDQSDYESLAVFSKFDPQSKTWSALPSMPTPRSSFDAAVVDCKLYVVGGWNLQGVGTQSAEWREDALVFDLTNERGEWSTITKPPFQARALTCASHAGKLYVLGGMKSSNQTTKEVHIYDPNTKAWSAGPELKSAGNFGGFAIAAHQVGGKLYYCGGDGTVYVLSDNGDQWNAVERLLFSRMFHRVTPAGDDRLAVIAGVAGGAYLASTEVVDLKAGASQELKHVSWDVSFSGRPRHSQALLVQGSSLYAFGGNASPQPHNFSKESFVDEAFRFDLATRTVESLSKLPMPVQSGGAFVAGNRIDQSIYVLGGLTHTDGQFQSTDAIQQYRLRSKSWSEEERKLPAPRGMFGLATFEGAAWILGGSQVKGRSPGLTNETWQWNPLVEDKPVVSPPASIPHPRRSFGVAIVGKKLYAIGGLGNNSQIVSQVDVFDLEARTWSEAPAPNQPRVFPSVAVADGKIYLSGGFSRVNGHFAGTTEIERFDPETGAWTTVFQELAPTLAEMNMLEFQDRLLFYNIDKDQAGLAHFVLLDPSPHSMGVSAMTTPSNEPSEASEMAARLMRHDKNQDGKLARDEVSARILPILEKADANSDGVAEKSEVEAYVKRELEANRPASGGNGPPGQGGPGGRGGPPSAERLLEQNDANKDGKLSSEEIPERLRQRMEGADKNGDGGIDKTELEAVLASPRSRDPASPPN